VKISELTQEQHEQDVEIVLREDHEEALADAIALLEKVAALDIASLPMSVVYIVADTLHYLAKVKP
jgi:hypothetical protein